MSASRRHGPEPKLLHEQLSDTQIAIERLTAVLEAPHSDYIPELCFLLRSFLFGTVRVSLRDSLSVLPPHVRSELLIILACDGWTDEMESVVEHDHFHALIDI